MKITTNILQRQKSCTIDNEISYLFFFFFFILKILSYTLGLLLSHRDCRQCFVVYLWLSHTSNLPPPLLSLKFTVVIIIVCLCARMNTCMPQHVYGNQENLSKASAFCHVI